MNAGRAHEAARDAIAEQAARWIVRIHEGELTPDAREELRCWLLESALHDREFRRTHELWANLASYARDRYPAHELIRSALQEPARPPRRLLRVAACALASVAVGVGCWYMLRVDSPLRYATAAGELRTIELSDGSKLQLNTKSDASIQYTALERRVDLRRGEARFTVIHDPARPFVVSTPQAVVRSLGTVFNVRTLSLGTNVAVFAGRVEVSARSSDAWRTSRPGSATFILEQGKHALITPDGAILPGSGAVLERAVGWPQRQLAFANEPLAQVVAEINRYSARPVRIEDARLAAVRLSGKFSTQDLDSLLAYLERFCATRVEHHRDGAISLHWRETSPGSCVPPALRGRAGH